METRAFINRIRSLYGIESFQLPEFTAAQQSDFIRNPLEFFLRAGDAEADAIMREVERRQGRTPADIDVKAPRAKRLKPGTDGQREMLLPISGRKVAVESGAAPEAKGSIRRKAV